MKTHIPSFWQITGTALCAIALFTSGCVTTYDNTRTHQVVQEREDILLLREDIRRLSGRVEIIESELDRIARDLHQQRAEQVRAAQTGQQTADARIADLNRRIAEVDRLREQDKKEIVERLSKTIEQMMRTAAPTPPRGSSGARGTTTTASSGRGVEHVVGPGQTLSEIASAYGVRPQVIIDANQLRNPDRLQVGQKLFIPD